MQIHSLGPVRMARLVASHVRQHVIAYIALFFALGAGTAFATVTQIETGPGLTGGPITGSGTISISEQYRLPQPCAPGSIPKFNGASWLCSPDSAVAVYRQRSSGRVVEVEDTFPKYTKVRSVRLPAAGSYLVLARVDLTAISTPKTTSRAKGHEGYKPGNGACRVWGGADYGELSVAGASRSYPSSSSSLLLQAVIRAHSPVDVEVECTRDTNSGRLQVRHGNITALPLGDVAIQAP